MRIVLLAALAACTQSPTTDDTSSPDTSSPETGDTGSAPLPKPVIAMAIRQTHGALDATCEIGFDVLEGGEDGTVIGHYGFTSARGGEWAAGEVEIDQVYAVIGTDSGCADVSDEQPDVSGGFSLVMGAAEIWWWRSTDFGFELVGEGEDFERGRALLHVDEGTPAEDVVAAMAELEITATAVDGDSTGWDLDFDDARSVPLVLSQVSLYPRFTEGAPVWRGSVPGWW